MLAAAGFTLLVAFVDATVGCWTCLNHLPLPPLLLLLLLQVDGPADPPGHQAACWWQRPQ